MTQSASDKKLAGIVIVTGGHHDMVSNFYPKLTVFSANISSDLFFDKINTNTDYITYLYDNTGSEYCIVQPLSFSQNSNVYRQDTKNVWYSDWKQSHQDLWNKNFEKMATRFQDLINKFEKYLEKLSSREANASAKQDATHGSVSEKAVAKEYQSYNNGTATLYNAVHTHISDTMSTTIVGAKKRGRESYDMQASVCMKFLQLPEIRAEMLHLCGLQFNQNLDVNDLSNLSPGYRGANIFMLIFEMVAARLYDRNKQRLSAPFTVQCHRITQLNAEIGIASNETCITTGGVWKLGWGAYTFAKFYFNFFNPYKRISCYKPSIVMTAKLWGLNYLKSDNLGDLPDSDTDEPMLVAATAAKSLVHPEFHEIIDSYSDIKGDDDEFHHKFIAPFQKKKTNEAAPFSTLSTTSTSSSTNPPADPPADPAGEKPKSQFPNPINDLHLTGTKLLSDADIKSLLKGIGYTEKDSAAIIKQKTDLNAQAWSGSIPQWMQQTGYITFITQYTGTLKTAPGAPKVKYTTLGIHPPKDITVSLFSLFPLPKRARIFARMINAVQVHKVSYSQIITDYKGSILDVPLPYLFLNCQLSETKGLGEIVEKILPHGSTIGVQVRFPTSSTLEYKKLQSLPSFYVSLSVQGPGYKPTPPGTPVIQPKASEALFSIGDSFAVTSLSLGLELPTFGFRKNSFTPFLLEATCLISNIHKDPIQASILGSYDKVIFQLTISLSNIVDPFGLSGFTINQIYFTARHAGSSWSVDARLIFTISEEITLSLQGSYISKESYSFGGGLKFLSNPKNPAPKPPGTLSELLPVLASLFGAEMSHHSALDNIVLNSLSFNITRSASSASPSGDTPGETPPKPQGKETIFSLSAEVTFHDFVFDLSGTFGPDLVDITASVQKGTSDSLDLGFTTLKSISLKVLLASKKTNKETLVSLNGMLDFPGGPYPIQIEYNNGAIIGEATLADLSLEKIASVLKPINFEIQKPHVQIVTKDTPDGIYKKGFTLGGTVVTFPGILKPILQATGPLAIEFSFSQALKSFSIETTKNLTILNTLTLIAPFSLGAAWTPGQPTFGFNSQFDIEFSNKIGFLHQLGSLKGFFNFATTDEGQDLITLGMDLPKISKPANLGIILTNMQLSFTFGTTEPFISVAGDCNFPATGLDLHALISVAPDEQFIVAIKNLPDSSGKLVPISLPTIINSLISMFTHSAPLKIPTLFEIKMIDMVIDTINMNAKFDTDISLFGNDINVSITAGVTGIKFYAAVHEFNLFGLKVAGSKLNKKDPHHAIFSYDVLPLELRADFLISGSINLFGLLHIDVFVKMDFSVDQFKLIIDAETDFAGLSFEIKASCNLGAKQNSFFFEFIYSDNNPSLSQQFDKLLKKATHDLERLINSIPKAEMEIAKKLEQGLGDAYSDLNSFQHDLNYTIDSIETHLKTQDHFMQGIGDSVEKMKELENVHGETQNQKKKALHEIEQQIHSLIIHFNQESEKLHKEFVAEKAKMKAEIDAANIDFTSQVAVATAVVDKINARIEHDKSIPEPSKPSPCDDIVTFGTVQIPYALAMHKYHEVQKDLRAAQAQLKAANANLQSINDSWQAKIKSITQVYTPKIKALNKDYNDAVEIGKQLSSWNIDDKNTPLAQYVDEMEAGWSKFNQEWEQEKATFQSDLDSLQTQVTAATNNAKQFNKKLIAEIQNALKGSKDSRMSWIQNLRNAKSYLTQAVEAISAMRMYEKIQQMMSIGDKLFHIDYFKFSFDTATWTVTVAFKLTIIGIHLESSFSIDFKEIFHIVEHFFSWVWSKIKGAF